MRRLIETITPAHWRKMTEETRLGWPMVRDRMAALCQKTVNALRDPGVPGSAKAEAMVGRVAGIVEERASSLLRSLK